MPAEKISISGYARVVDELLDELGRRAPPRRGQLDGRLHRRRAGDPLPRRASSGSCSVSAAGLTIEYQRDERALAVLRRLDEPLAAYGGWFGHALGRARAAPALRGG